jgi:5'-3' exonuclease
MGINNFFKIFRDQTQSSKVEPQNERIVIDGSWLVYNTFLATRSIRTMSHNGTPTGHLRIIFNKIKKLQKNGNKMIVVWDNGTTALKTDVCDDRKARREDAQIRLTEAKADPNTKQSTLNRLEKLGVSPGKAFVSAKKLISLFGIPQLTADAKYEAEHIAAEICRLGYADLVYTKDSDALVFGATAMGWHSKGKFHRINLADILKAHEIDRPTLAKIGVILGCDFAPKTSGVGPGTVFARVNSVVLTDKQKQAEALFLEQPNLEIIVKCLKTLENKVDVDEVKKYLISLGFNGQKLGI